MAWSIYIFLLVHFTVAGAETATEILIHPEFSFEQYPTLESISDMEPQPYKFATAIPIYYSHIYGSLRSPVQGNITQIRYIAPNSFPIMFQIWNMENPADPKIKAVLPVVPEAGGDDIKTALPAEDIAIDVGDMIGVWVEWEYPLGTWQLLNQATSDYLVHHNQWKAIQPQDAPPSAAKSVVMSTSSPNQPAYISALEVNITYEAVATTTTTTTTTTAPDPTTTIISTTTSPTVAPTTENTTAPTTDNTTVPLAENTTVSATVPASTPKTASSSIKTPSDDTTSQKNYATTSIAIDDELESNNGTTVSASRVTGLTGSLFYIVIIVPIATAILLFLLVPAVVCAVRKHNREGKKIAELKRTYHMGGAVSTEPDAEMIQNLELTGSLRYPQPMVNTAFQSEAEVTDRGQYQIGEAKDMNRSRVGNNIEDSYSSTESPDMYNNLNTNLSNGSNPSANKFGSELYTHC